MSEDFSKGKRGPVVKSDPKKVRITIRLDSDIIEHFKNQVLAIGGGNYQSLINEARSANIYEKAIRISRNASGRLFGRS